MLQTTASRVFVAIGVAAGAAGLALDIASWGWSAAPALLLPAALCAGGVVAYLHGRSHVIRPDGDAGSAKHDGPPGERAILPRPLTHPPPRRPITPVQPRAGSSAPRPRAPATGG
jgi:hypothetical protein